MAKKKSGKQIEREISLALHDMAKRPHHINQKLAALKRKVHQAPTGRLVYAAHERDGHITTAGRRALTRAQFALPPGPEEKRRGIKGRLPIDTDERAHDALTRASAMHKRGHLSARELAQARSAVHKAWPSIKLSH